MPSNVHWTAREPTLGIRALLAVHKYVDSRETNVWGQRDGWFAFGLWGSPWSWAFHDLVAALPWSRRIQLSQSSRTRSSGLPVDYPVFVKPDSHVGWVTLGSASS